MKKNNIETENKVNKIEYTTNEAGKKAVLYVWSPDFQQLNF